MYTFNWFSDLFTCTFYGHLNLKAIKNALLTLDDEAPEKSIFRGLMDFSNINDSNLSVRNAIYPAAHDLGFTHCSGHPIKFAMVYSHDVMIPFLHKYKELVDSLPGELSVEIFTNKNEALVWLDKFPGDLQEAL